MEETPIVFFSGGTALKETAAALSRRKVPTAHIITTFDSGGSSASLRRAFGMPAVGDIRSRVLSLACEEDDGVADTCALLQHRIDKNASAQAAKDEYDAIVQGTHILARPEGERLYAVRESLRALSSMPAFDFPLAGASIGNLIVCERYLACERQLEPAVEFLSSLVSAFGRVQGIAEASAHLAVRLQCGTVIPGQHRFTGKEALSVTSPVSDLWLCRGEDDPTPCTVSASAKVLSLIRSASCLCFPMGSFFSSVIANLLPEGVREAIQETTCPRVFIPNPGPDPELLGHSVEEQIAFLLKFLGGDGIVTHMLIDGRAPRCKGLDPDFYRRKGIEVVFQPLFSDSASCLYNGALVALALERLRAEH